MRNQHILDDVISSPIAVLGLGISNLPLILFLLDHGAKEITARDKKPFDELAPAVKALAERGVHFVCGEDYMDHLTEKTVFRSPGVYPFGEALARVRANGGRVTSEMQLFFDLCPATVLGITGSDGKTTTTTLTYQLLQKESERRGGAFKVYCGGNIGMPLLPRVEEMTEDDFAVVELSSFQLQDMTSAPSHAIVTNVTPNHLNWHKDYEEYIEAKKHILPKNGVTVLNADNAVTRGMADEVGRPILFSSSLPYSDLHARYGEHEYIYLQNGHMIYTYGGKSECLLDVSKIRVVGRHNVENFMAAAALTLSFIDNSVLRELAPEFCGVRHRLEFVRERGGVKYYNSSIDSSPNRTRVTLEALMERPIVICGGAAKGLTFEMLADSLVSHAKAVVLTGATAETIEKELLRHPLYDEENLPILRRADFREAILAAADIAESGDTVLLSPACTSYDAFKNFEERGDTFVSIVRSLPELDS
ncbi:MAG: UDP-N-acetylmuramoyl-L-alanine--D-glutamate ligase [Clostridia bacterium]|nr:UDP-N-acetylmuramoyl-L-alanine--D-glutamate ligase [Clostridia bacterium]